MTLLTTVFAEACYDQNSKAELIEALAGPADKTDCEAWQISADEWRAAIQQALDARTEDDDESKPYTEAE
jgi:hypothetical protein